MQETQRLVFSPFHFDVTTQALWREGQRLSLQAKTGAVLAYLLQHPQQLVTTSKCQVTSTKCPFPPSL